MGLNSLIIKLEKLGKYRVKFTLKQPQSAFIAILAMDFLSILSAEYDKQVEKNIPSQINNLPIGTGPFQFIKYSPDIFIRYKAHSLYWGKNVKLHELVFAITPNPYLRYSRLIAGECDVMAKPLPIHLKNAKKKPMIVRYAQAGLNIAYLSMNTKKKPFDNPVIRRALNLGINKKRLLSIIYNSSAVLATNPIPPTIWAFNPNIKAIEYSPKKARLLLKKEGFSKGFKMDLWAMTIQRTYNPNAKKMAELIQQDLKKIGIKVTIISYEFGTFLEKVKRGEHHAALLGWIGDNGDPDNFFSPLLSCASTYSGSNRSFWCHKQFDYFIHQARNISNKEQRKIFYYKAQEIFNQSLPWVPIAYTQQFVLAHKRVKNFKLMPTEGIFFNHVALEKMSH
jgi:dipeptide transport system substrate-binding protein